MDTAYIKDWTGLHDSLSAFPPHPVHGCTFYHLGRTACRSVSSAAAAFCCAAHETRSHTVSSLSRSLSLSLAASGSGLTDYDGSGLSGSCQPRPSPSNAGG